jgi:hypothetical protein
MNRILFNVKHLQMIVDSKPGFLVGITYGFGLFET